jgi:ABC-2 type transport system permease protein
MNEGINTDIDLVIFYESHLGLSNIEFIRSDVKNIRDNLWLWNKYGIDRQQLESNNVKVDIMQIENKGGYGADGKKSQPVSLFIIAMFSGIIIYFFIFMFGVQVLRGVIEEKTSRIVEIIISSVRPFQLMMGKIIGVALVGLTQFLLWIVFTFVIVGFVAFAFPDSFSADNLVQEQFMSPGANLTEQENLAINEDTIDTIEQLYLLVNDIPVKTIIFSFLFYFLFGYLMYSALFASVGAAVDNEADTQQFMLPITIPLILGLIMSSFILNNPSGPVAVWLSIIPFTSPIVMMMRIPFGVPIFELVISMAVLVATFLFITWIAAKIYKTGILMYGKKPSYKEIWKWIKYKG